MSLRVLTGLVAIESGCAGFLAIYLTSHNWSETSIGAALSVGTIAAMVGQLPAGALVDQIGDKRYAAAGALVALTAAIAMLAMWPRGPVVFAAEILFGLSGCFLGPSIAAITLALSDDNKFGEHLGHNVRFGAIGSVVAALALGAIGYRVSHSAIFWVAAAVGVPALVAVASIRRPDLAVAPIRNTHPASQHGVARPKQQAPARAVLLNGTLIAFATAMALFQMSNAAVLPIASSMAERVNGQSAELVLAGLVVLPQLVAAVLSPRAGRAAQDWGRRPLLIAGFAVLPLRIVLFYSDPNHYHMVLYQALDGITAAVLGVVVPLVVSDITRRSGRFNLAMGVVGLAVGLGASLSTIVAGAIDDMFGSGAVFLALAAMGVIALMVIIGFMPETRGLVGRRESALRPA